MDGQAISILAWEWALNRLGGDRQFLSELIGCFLVDLEGYLGDLRAAAGDEDRGQIGELARSIREKASGLGAVALARAADRLAQGLPSHSRSVEDLAEEAACLRGYLCAIQEGGAWSASTS
jgi:HPt (histidine-containing phosphotransfer) domain-containing protein